MAFIAERYVAVGTIPLVFWGQLPRRCPLRTSCPRRWASHWIWGWGWQREGAVGVPVLCQRRSAVDKTHRCNSKSVLAPSTEHSALWAAVGKAEAIPGSPSTPKPPWWGRDDQAGSRGVAGSQPKQSPGGWEGWGRCWVGRWELLRSPTEELRGTVASGGVLPGPSQGPPAQRPRPRESTSREVKVEGFRGGHPRPRTPGRRQPTAAAFACPEHRGRAGGTAAPEPAPAPVPGVGTELQRARGSRTGPPPPTPATHGCPGLLA